MNAEPNSDAVRSAEPGRSALDHAREHNEHATRPNQHDEAWAAGEIACEPDDPSRTHFYGDGCPEHQEDPNG